MPSKIPTPNTKRNPNLFQGLKRFGGHAQYARKGIWAIKTRNATTAKKAEKAAFKVKSFGKKNEKRTIYPKVNVWTPTDPVPKKNKTKTSGTKGKKATLRASITPGTVLILLTGRFRARRVIFLRQLKSGLLLVTGPHKINGVPLKRVNQRYVIATSTKVDISGVNVDPKFDDNYFRAEKKDRQKKSEAAFFAKEGGKGKKSAQKPEKKKASPEKVADQKSVDAGIVEAIKKVPELAAYLNAHFTLRKGQNPHEMQF